MILVDDSLMDSLPWMGLATGLEGHFDLVPVGRTGPAITDDEVAEWKTLADVVAIVTRRAAEGRVPLPSVNEVWQVVAGMVALDFQVPESQLTPATSVAELNLRRRGINSHPDAAHSPVMPDGA